MLASRDRLAPPSALALALAFGFAACGHAPSPRPVVVPSQEAAPTLTIEHPSADELVREAELTVSGRVSSYDGRAWVFVDATRARVEGGHFVAEHVPVHEGRVIFTVNASDGRGRHAQAKQRVVVESLDRPRSAEVCDDGRCLRYEVRGRPTRDAAGHVTNAVLVLPAFGLDERLDEMWPDLVGPGRALDPRERLIIGVGAVSSAGAPLDDAAALWPLIGRLMATLSLDAHTPVAGVGYGGELALRGLANGTFGGAVLVAGAHDRPFDEPALRALKVALAGTPSWDALARLIVPATYGARYLADASHAVEQGLVSEAREGGLAAALERELAAHYRAKLPVARLAARLEQAFALAARPLDYPALDGRRVILVDNRQDGLADVKRVHALAIRLLRNGAAVTSVDLDDPAGHAAFFLHAPLALEAALRTLVSSSVVVKR